MSECRTRFEFIIDGRVSEKLRSCGNANSFGHPSKYFYLNSGAFSAEFTMQKEDVASVITHYNRSIDMKDKFVLRLIDDIWLIDEKYYGFEDEKTSKSRPSKPKDNDRIRHMESCYFPLEQDSTTVPNFANRSFCQIIPIDTGFFTASW